MFRCESTSEPVIIGQMHTDLGKNAGANRMRQDRPVGLTGGIASGKTTVSAMFRTLGATIINADIISAAVLDSGSPALAELARYFGSSILLENGALNRTAMLDILITERGALQHQLDILRPYVLPAIDKISRKALESQTEGIVIVEAPMLFEYGKPERYHPIVLVSVNRETQVERLMKRSGKSEHWANKVIDLQWPMERKSKFADYIINNEQKLSATRAQVAQTYRRLIDYFNH